MDFVISKLGLSICALLALSVLEGALTEPLSATERQELDAVGERFDCLVSSLVEGGGTASHIYDVPWLSTDSPIVMLVRTGGVEVVSENARSVTAASSPLHLWTWDGARLNRSSVEELDASCNPLEVVSGDHISIAVLRTPVQGVLTTMVFIGAAESEAAVTAW